jgi:polyferredoxin
MTRARPVKLSGLGLGLLLGSWVLLFVMVLRFIEPSLALSFLGYGASLAGLLFGLLGVIELWRPRR